MAVVPTLLIGLGGVGSSIVDAVYGMMKPEDRKLLEVRVMDTDVNWIKSKLKNIREDFVIQTSDDMTVGMALDRDPTASEWFARHPILEQKLIINGAGQVRSISRLALRAAMKAGKLQSLEMAIKNLKHLNPDTVGSGYRVMIVSSMVGGTGSGMFLQIPMYIRDLFRESGVDRVLIRGAFLLPDIFLDAVPRSQHQNIKANAYAAMKELNAITSAASGGPSDQVTIELEYKPGMVGSTGISDNTINIYKLPYDASFIYDRQNDLGQILPGASAYLDQVAKCIYTTLASPIAEAYYSLEDNEVLELVRQNGKNRFCGAAVALVSYPYEDIVNYCGTRWVADSLDESWLKLDYAFEQEYKDYKTAVSKGEDRPQPKRAESYMRNFDQEISSDVARPFFKTLKSQVNMQMPDKGPGMSKAALFMNQVAEQVTRVIESDAQLAAMRQQCSLDETALKMEESKAINEISSMETALEAYRETLMTKLVEYKTTISNGIIFGDVDLKGDKGYSDAMYRLNTWLLGKNDPVHPVASRYLMYRIQAAMENKIAELTESNSRKLETINKYREVYNIKETEEIEDAETRYRMASKKYFIFRNFNKHLEGFVEEYMQKTRKQLNLLRQYQGEKLLELVLSTSLKHLNQVIKEHEQFFDNLKDIKRSMDIAIDEEAERHNRSADISTLHVLADRSHKEQLWEQVKPQLDADVTNGDISKQIYLSLYRQAYQSLFNERYERVSAKELFETQVLDFSKKHILENVDSLKMDVVTALRKQASLEGNTVSEEEDFVITKINELTKRARPFVPKVSSATEYTNWGLHPDVVSQLPGNKLDMLFSGNRTISDRFSPYEMIRYMAYLGLSATDFPKFAAKKEGFISQPVNGDYFENYQQRIKLLSDTGYTALGSESLLPEQTVTPHIDKRWHLPAYLPDINEHIQNQINEDIMRAYIKGLAYGWIRLNQDTPEISNFIYSGENNFKHITKSGNRIGDRLDLLLEAMSYYRAVVDEIVMRAKQYEEDDRKNIHELDNHRFIKGIMNLPLKGKKSHNLLDVLVEYRLDVPDSQYKQNKYLELVDYALIEIIDYCMKAKSSNPQSAATTAISVVNQLWADCQFKNHDGAANSVAMIEDRLNIHVDKLKRTHGL